MSVSVIESRNDSHCSLGKSSNRYDRNLKCFAKLGKTKLDLSLTRPFHSTVLNHYSPTGVGSSTTGAAESCSKCECDAHPRSIRRPPFIEEAKA